MTAESDIQTRVRLAAAKQGATLWRNNNGAGQLQNGSYVRWGLANDSTAVNRRIKSADLIGIRPVLITQADVGRIVGVFCSREVKTSGWRYHENNEHEQAQMRWLELVQRLGGDAAFTTGEWR